MTAILAFLPILLKILKMLPKVLALIKAGTVALGEIEKWIKWGIRHKEAGAKTLYVVPQEAVKMEVLKPSTTKPADAVPTPQVLPTPPKITASDTTIVSGTTFRVVQPEPLPELERLKNPDTKPAQNFETEQRYQSLIDGQWYDPNQSNK